MKLRNFTVAILTLAFSGLANAAISAGDSADPMELFLVAWDGSGNTTNTYVQDLGIDPLSQDWNTGSQSISIDTSTFNGLFGGETDLRYAVLASENSARAFQVFFTGATDLDVNTVFAGASGFGDLNQAVGAIQNFVRAGEHSQGSNADNLVSTATSGNGVVPGAFYTGNLSDNDIGAVPNGAALGEALGFYTVGLDFNTGAAAQTAFAGTFLLDVAATVLTFGSGVSPIPLPAGVWLLGSALFGLVGISRRRRAVAAAA